MRILSTYKFKEANGSVMTKPLLNLFLLTLIALGVSCGGTEPKPLTKDNAEEAIQAWVSEPTPFSMPA